MHAWLIEQREYVLHGVTMYEFHVESRSGDYRSFMNQMQPVFAAMYEWCKDTLGEESPHLVMQMDTPLGVAAMDISDARWVRVMPSVYRFTRKSDFALFKLTWSNVDHLRLLMVAH